MKADIYKTLQDTFHLEDFRTGQKEIITSVLDQKDVLALMPTGGGKSLCYQLPAVFKQGLTIVITPLISLMEDQVRSLKKLNVPSGYIHSGQTVEEKKKVFQSIESSKTFILFLSPERVNSEGFRSWVKKREDLTLFAIDEAHCASQWGHDFRPDYSELAQLKKIRPEIPVIALTATATPLVKHDIKKILKLKKPEEHVYGFYRPNLFYQVEFCEKEDDKKNLVLQALHSFPEGKIILYCGTRKKTEQWAEDIKEDLGDTGEDTQVGFYHAGLSNEQRERVAEKYEKGDYRILTATNAFGMGIDHSDIRLVVHTQMPGNIESYYQEMGRAGRDGHPSHCLLTYSKKDKSLHHFFIKKSEAPRPVIQKRWDALDSIVNYAEGSECRHSDILTYFRDKKRINRCGHCDVCAPKDSLTFVRELPLKKKSKGSLETLRLSPGEKDLKERLKEWRKDFAKEKDLPAFMIFSDKTLNDLVKKHPKSKSELLNVYGLGSQKVDFFGKEVLDQLEI